jgi:hypothetical protein
MKRRTWHYTQKPPIYGIECDLCGGGHLEWSEFEHRVWCYNCKKDVKGTPGIFGGPIPVGASAVLGIYFHRWDMKKKRVLIYNEVTGKYVPAKERAARGKDKP